MDKARLLLAAALAAAAGLAQAQHFRADYSLTANRNWFGVVGVSQESLNTLTPGTADTLNVGGGYRFNDGQSLSLQVSRGGGPVPRLGLAVSYGWPRYFVRLSYDQGIQLTPADQFRFSAGVRF